MCAYPFYLFIQPISVNTSLFLVHLAHQSSTLKLIARCFKLLVLNLPCLHLFLTKYALSSFLLQLRSANQYINMRLNVDNSRSVACTTNLPLPAAHPHHIIFLLWSSASASSSLTVSFSLTASASCFSFLSCRPILSIETVWHPYRLVYTLDWTVTVGFTGDYD